MESRSFVKALSLVALLFGAVACGGGSGGGGGGGGGGNPPGTNPPPDPNPPPVADTTPDAFEFAPVASAEPGEVYSASAVIRGINRPSSISVEGGEYRINDRAPTSEPGQVANGETVTVLLAAPLGVEESVTATVTVGGVSSNFSVTTRPENVPPELEVHFPLSEFYPEAPAGTILTFRGTASDETGVVTVTVNGEPADTDSDFARWSADVVLENGVLDFVVTAVDTKGNSTSKTLRRRTIAGPFGSGPDVRGVFDMEFDAENQRIIYTQGDGPERGVYALDIATLQRTKLSTSFNLALQPGGLTRPVGQSVTFVAQRSSHAVVSMDAEGQGEVFSAGTDADFLGSRGTGPNVTSPGSLVSDPASGRVWVFARSREILELDVATMSGDRVITSDNTHAGPPFGIIEDIAFDTTRNRLIALDISSDIVGSGRDAIIAINPETGTRTAISHAALGVGPPMGFEQFHRGLMYDPVSDRILVFSHDQGSLLAVHSETGDREELAGPSRGDGPLGLRPKTAALDEVRRIVYAALPRTDEEENMQIFAIDLETGDRVVIER